MRFQAIGSYEKDEYIIMSNPLQPPPVTCLEKRFQIHLKDFHDIIWQFIKQFPVNQASIRFLVLYPRHRILLHGATITYDLKENS